MLEPEKVKKKKRNITSAIPDESVQTIRKLLDKMRKCWSTRHENENFSTTMKLNEKYSMDEFAYRFTLGHHLKRHKKNSNHR